MLQVFGQKSNSERSMWAILFQRDPVAGNRINFYIVGAHSSHSELRTDTFNDVAYLLKRRPLGSKAVVVGDCNVDQLPSLQVDPYLYVPRRDEWESVC